MKEFEEDFSFTEVIQKAYYFKRETWDIIWLSEFSFMRIWYISREIKKGKKEE